MGRKPGPHRSEPGAPGEATKERKEIVQRAHEPGAGQRGESAVRPGGPWCSRRPSSAPGAAAQPHSHHPSLPCPPVSLQRAPSRSNQDCNCSRACLALAQLRLSGFPFWTEIVCCLSPTFTPSAQTSAARRGPGRCQPLLCQSLSPGPPPSPTANWGCFHALLGGSELLMGEEMPLGVLGPLRQPHQGCCWRQE